MSDELFNSVERTSAEQRWANIGKYLNTNQANFPMSPVSPGAKNTQDVYDAMPSKFVRNLASAIQGSLTNPATVWSRLEFGNDALNNDQESPRWLDNANLRMHREFNSSNFNLEIEKAWLNFACYGNLVLLQEEIREAGIFSGYRFKALHLGNVAWTEDKNGIVDTLHRKFKLTARQAIQMWGKNVPDRIMREAIKDPHKKFQFLHIIQPREKKQIDENKPNNPLKRPVSSVYIDVDHNEIIEEGGFFETPFYVARWELMPEEMYGRGPGDLALPDVKTLNTLKKMTFKGLAKQVDPPFLINRRDVLGTIDLRAGQGSVVNNIGGFKELVSGARTDIGKMEVKDLHEQIKSIFFLDMLFLPDRRDTGEMTAFEIARRVEEVQRVLGPVLSRINVELLQPLIVRSFKILLRSGQLGELPLILQEEGFDFDVEFINQLARAQQMEDVNNITQWTQIMLGAAQANPAVLDYIDADNIAKHTAKVLGVPQSVVLSDKQVAEVRKQRQEQIAQQQQVEMSNKAADTASKLQGMK